MKGTCRMCGHFALGSLTLQKLLERYAIALSALSEEAIGMNMSGFYPSRGAATTLVPIVTGAGGQRRLEAARWDLVPSWWKKPLAEKKFSSFNARDDSLLEKASFKGAWNRGRRCIIPATRFFEWPNKGRLARGAQRVEHAIELSDQVIFSMAGIWDECGTGACTGLRSCAIITTSANRLMESIPHTRMPVIIPPGQEDAWLAPSTTPEEAFAMLDKYPGENMKIIV